MADNWWEGLTPETIYVDDETWDELMAMLDEEPKVVPGLVELFQREGLGQDD